jgi:hypothetical protein
MNTLNRRTALRRLGATLTATALAATLLACGGGGGEGGPAMSVNGNGVSSFDAPQLGATLSGYAMQPVSAAEAEGLAYMREEEQLAHAVYAASATRWTAVPLFANIAASESTHTAAVKTLLDRYSLSDPLAGLPATSFRTPAFTQLYEQLVAASALSLVQALQVGAQIEELDIHDIQVRLASVDNSDIQLVYDNLQRGSRNHLRAFMSQLRQLGGTYTPQYLSQAEFDAILAAPMESGR